MRLKHLQNRLAKEKVDYLFLFNDDPNFTCLTGLVDTSFSLLAVPKSGKPILFITSLDKEKVDSKTRNILIKKSFSETVKKYLKPQKIAYHSSKLSINDYKKLRKIFPKIKFKDFFKILTKLRLEKTDEEIIYLKKAANLTDKAFKQIVLKLNKRKFKTENDILFFLHKFSLDNNTKLSFPPIIASGINSRNPHHETGNKKIVNGFLLLDFGISYRNYCSDMTRMIYVGKPKQEELKFYELLLNVQQEAIKNLKIGIKYKDIEQQTRTSLGKYSSYFIHSLGHGLGVEIHEPLDVKLKRNQVFTVEPGVYFKEFGLRIEDTILMQEKPLILTKTSKNLLVIPKII